MPKSAEMPDPFDLNGWLNLGRRSERNAMDILREAGLASAFNIDEIVMIHNRAIVCADGYSVSIQACHMCYCRPKKSIDDISAYEAFELGYPTKRDECLAPYGHVEDGERGIFGYVPRSVVEELIAIHGGIVSQIELPDEMPLLTPGEPLNGEE